MVKFCTLFLIADHQTGPLVLGDKTAVMFLFPNHDHHVWMVGVIAAVTFWVPSISHGERAQSQACFVLMENNPRSALLLQFLAIESQKQGGGQRWVTTGDQDTCPENGPMVQLIPQRTVMVHQGTDAPVAYELNQSDEDLAIQLVAQEIVRDLNRARTSHLDLLIDQEQQSPIQGGPTPTLMEENRPPDDERTPFEAPDVLKADAQEPGSTGESVEYPIETKPLRLTMDAAPPLMRPLLTPESPKRQWLSLGVLSGLTYSYTFNASDHLVGSSLELSLDFMDGIVSLALIRHHMWAPLSVGVGASDVLGAIQSGELNKQIEVTPSVYGSTLVPMLRLGFPIGKVSVRGGLGLGWHRLPYLPEIPEQTISREEAITEEDRLVLAFLEEECQAGDDEACDDARVLADEFEGVQDEITPGEELDGLNSLASIHGLVARFDAEVRWFFREHYFVGVRSGLRINFYVQYELDMAMETQAFAGVRF